MFHDRMTEVGDRLIAKYGDDVTLIQIGNVTYDPDTGEDTSTKTSHAIKGYVSNMILSALATEDVKIGDMRVLVCLAHEVTKDWEVLWDGKIWKVIDVTKIRTQNYTITQALQVRSNG